MARSTADEEMIVVRHVRKELESLAPRARLRVFKYILEVLEEEKDLPWSAPMATNGKQVELPLEENPLG